MPLSPLRNNWSRLVPAALALSVAAACVTSARGSDATTNAKTLLADQLACEARAAGQNPQIPATLATREALDLLQTAHKVAPNDVEVMRLLSEAALASGNASLAQDVLGDLVRADPGDYLAQVKWLDLKAAKEQAAEQQLAIYQHAADSSALNPQVRSAMAFRASQLLAQRGQSDDAAAALRLSLQLNEANLDALRENARELAAAGSSSSVRLQSMIDLLQANPYQPDVLIAAARLVSSNNMHNTALDWLNAAAEQMQAAGAPLTPDFIFETAIEMDLAQRNADLQDFFHGLSDAPNAPMNLLLLYYSINAPGGMVPARPGEPLIANIRKRFDDQINADPKNVQLLADAVWFDLFYAPAIQDSTMTRLDQLKQDLDPANPTLKRLTAWFLLRSDKLEEARKQLEPLAADDVNAALGLVRIDEAEEKKDQAVKEILDIAQSHPLGLAQHHLAALERKYEITPPEAPDVADVRTVAQGLPKSVLTAARSPRDVFLITSDFSQAQYDYGQPVLLTLHFFNATDRPLAMGPGGASTGSVALMGGFRGWVDRDLGVFAMDNIQRQLRLDGHASMDVAVRVDQGTCRSMLLLNPTRLVNVRVTALTEPRFAQDRVGPGMGGQKLEVGNFEQNDLHINSLEQLQQLNHRLLDLPPDQEMLVAGALANIVPGLEQAPVNEPTTVPAGTLTPAAVAPEVTDQLVRLLKSNQALAQAWMERWAPLNNLPQPISDAFAGLLHSPDPAVRMMGYFRMAQTNAAGDQREATSHTLADMGHADSDSLAGDYAQALSEQLAIPPATQPASTAASDTPGVVSPPATQP